MNFFKKKTIENQSPQTPPQNKIPGKFVGRIVIDVTQEGNNRNINVNIENLPIDTAYVALDVAKNSIVRGGPVPMGKLPEHKDDLSYVG